MQIRLKSSLVALLFLSGCFSNEVPQSSLGGILTSISDLNVASDNGGSWSGGEDNTWNDDENNGNDWENEGGEGTGEGGEGEGSGEGEGEGDGGEGGDEGDDWDGVFADPVDAPVDLEDPVVIDNLKITSLRSSISDEECGGSCYLNMVQFFDYSHLTDGLANPVSTVYFSVDAEGTITSLHYGSRDYVKNSEGKFVYTDDGSELNVDLNREGSSTFVDLQYSGFGKIYASDSSSDIFYFYGYPQRQVADHMVGTASFTGKTVAKLISEVYDGEDVISQENKWLSGDAVVNVARSGDINFELKLTDGWYYDVLGNYSVSGDVNNLVVEFVGNDALDGIEDTDRFKLKIGDDGSILTTEQAFAVNFYGDGKATETVGTLYMKQMTGTNEDTFITLKSVFGAKRE